MAWLLGLFRCVELSRVGCGGKCWRGDQKIWRPRRPRTHEVMHPDERRWNLDLSRQYALAVAAAIVARVRSVQPNSYQGPLILTREALPESPVHESLRSTFNSWSIGWLRYRLPGSTCRPANCVRQRRCQKMPG